MKIEHSSKDQIIRMLFFPIMVYTLSVVIGKVLLLEWSLTRQFFLILGLSLVTELIVMIPQSLLGLGIIFVGRLIYLNRWDPQLLVEWSRWLFQLLDNVQDHLRGVEGVFQSNALPLWMMLVSLLCLYTAFIIFRTKKIFLLLPLYLFAFIYYWYLYIDVAYPMLGLFLLLFFIIYGTEKQHKNSDAVLWLRTSVAYGLLIIFVAALLPKLEPLVSWGWVESQAQAYIPGLYGMRNDLIYSRSFGRSQFFDFSQTGFQTSQNRLGGPVNLGDQLVMEVDAPYPMYLRGNVKNYYENSLWRPTPEPNAVYQIGTLLPSEIPSGVPVSLEITHANLASQTVFSPYQPVRIRAQQVRGATMGEAYQMRFNGAVYKGETYQVQAVLPSADHLSLADQTWSQDVEAYLQLPDNLSPQIKALADEIVRESQTHLEKARALERYLRENYTYTLTPQVVPEKVDFVEYFLLEEKEGYCTYFATALAVLLRTQEIPSRYVEGYLMSTEQEGGLYQVRENNAHAWVEAYLGSAGWITFEATPAFAEPVLHEEVVAREPSIEAAEEAERNYRNQLQTALEDIEQPFIMEDFSPVDQQIEMPTNSRSVFSQTWEWGKTILQWIVLLCLLVGFPFLIVYRLFSIHAHQKRLKKTGLNTQIVHHYGNILFKLSQMRLPKQAGETVSEYAERMSYRIVDGPYPFPEITAIYIRAKFSPQISEQEEYEKIQAYDCWTERKVKRRMGKVKYYSQWILKGKA